MEISKLNSKLESATIRYHFIIKWGDKIFKVSSVVEHSRKGDKKTKELITVGYEMRGEVSDSSWNYDKPNTSEMVEIAANIARKHKEHGIEIYRYINQNRIIFESNPIWKELHQEKANGHKDEGLLSDSERQKDS